MKMWLTLRVEQEEGGQLSFRGTAYGSEIYTDEDGVDHEMNGSIDIPATREFTKTLAEILKEAEPQVKRAVRYSSARGMIAVESLRERAASAATKAEGKAKHARK